MTPNLILLPQPPDYRCAPKHLFLVPSFLMPSDQAAPHSEIFHSFKSITSITLIGVSVVSSILWMRKRRPREVTLA